MNIVRSVDLVQARSRHESTRRRWWIPCAASLLAFLCGALTQSPVIAAPVPEQERIPVDLRRTTLVVRDIDRSLPLYRDALGLKVIYDQVIGGTTRLVLLRANDDFVGVLGLMQRLNLTEPVPAPEFRKAQPGDPILVFNLQDLEMRFERISAAPDVRVYEAPRRIEYPGPGGSVIPVLFSAVWDADGNFIEINRILGAPAGR
jgi:catechol 2,3-dioxygenase-like lactoylglutathione lyase family enzyme